MTKYKNPFYTIWETIAVLDSAGASVLRNLPEDQFDWREDIVSVRVNRIYSENYEHHFEIEIHIGKEGFDTLVQMTGLDLVEETHSDNYVKRSIRPGTLIEIFALIPKEVQS